MRAKITFHLFNKAIWLSIILLLIQQIIVASSTIWITRLITGIQEGNVIFLWLGLYLASLFLPYFPGALALIEITKAKVKANVQFIQQFTEVYKGRLIEWANANNQTNKSAIITSEAPQTINSYFDYIYYFASTTLNVVLNLLTVALIVEPLLIVSYVVGIVLAFVILKLQKKWKKILALRAQQGRIKWIGMLWKAWDNILINNQYNFLLWKEKTNKRAQRLVTSALKLEGYSQSISIAMAFALLIPTFVLVVYFAITRVNDLTWIAMLVVVLPRLFQVLSYSYEMLFMLADFPMQQSRLKTIYALFDEAKLQDSSNSKNELEKRINWNKLSINSGEANPKDLIFQLPHSGRYTIKGENGSGKTSLLLLLKLLNPTTTFYLPPKHDLTFNISKDKHSTGQFATKALHELLEHSKAKILLLDEWDANLDKDNFNLINQALDKLSENIFVLESIHKK